MIMNADYPKSWHEANQLYLGRAIAQLRIEIENAMPYQDSPNQQPVLTQEESKKESWAFARPPALESICTLFDLTVFERKLLLLCAATEMDASFASLIAAANHDSQRTQPTFGFALSLLSDAHWSALTLLRPLRRWHLLELGAGETLATRTLRVQEPVLHYLAGLSCLDERLQPFIRPISEQSAAMPSHLAIADQIATAWSQAGAASTLPLIQLRGNPTTDKRVIAAAAAAKVGLRLHAISAWSLPQTTAELESLLQLWERDAILNTSALLLECEDDTAASPSAISWLMESIRCPLMIATREARKSVARSVLLFDVDKPTRNEQAELWKTMLPSGLPQLNGKLDSVLSQFNLETAAVQSAALRAISDLPDAATVDAEILANRLWNACRAQSRPRMQGLAQHIESFSAWDDLVLPQNQKNILMHIVVHVRQRAKVYENWGFADKGARGLGISALLAGPSGTGKTMAAEVLARELRLDLYRIDLSQIVSKYIGETEKNLHRVFEAAEEGAAVLLFDEADALFGKRSDVKDSHDRYANIEVSYLLQRMEAYRGLAILTTNRKSAMDQAFLRRIRFVVEFPFPDIAERAEIWRRVFPPATPTSELQIDRLARLHATGGNIRNIAMGAAFLAADAGQPVHMLHLLQSARNEFAKLEKPLPDMEVAGWA